MSAQLTDSLPAFQRGRSCRTRCPSSSMHHAGSYFSFSGLSDKVELVRTQQHLHILWPGTAVIFQETRSPGDLITTGKPVEQSLVNFFDLVLLRTSSPQSLDKKLGLLPNKIAVQEE